MTPDTTAIALLPTEAYIFSTSFAQQRLWFIDQLVPQNALYNVPTAIRLRGSLKVRALEQAFNEMVRRHETLRSHFQIRDGQLVQAIVPHLTLSLPVVDLPNSNSTGALSLKERAACQQRLILEASQQPFNLSQAPLLRVKLLKLEATEHILLLVLHHIVADGWSLAVIMQELSALYAAFAVGNSSPLPALPIQYADFAQWQRQWFQGEVLNTQLDYWRQQLADLPAVDLPGDRLRPPTQSYQGATQYLELSQRLSQGLEDLSQQAGVTLFIVLLAAFQTLLYRYTGQTDLPIGSPIANRNRSEIEGLIGFFVNTLVLRGDLSGNPPFRSLLERVRRVALEAYGHQDLPFEQLVADLQPMRSLSHTPLVQIMFALQSASTLPLKLEGLEVEFLEVESHVAKFDLTLSFENTAQGLKGSLEYSTDLFEADTIDRFLQHFQILLEGIVANPDQQIAALPLLSAAEQQQLLFAGNPTQASDSDCCIHQLIETQAGQTPDAIALAFSSSKLTYRELNDRANQLAYHLQQLGVQSDTLVGLCCDRSPELVIGMLAILKAGGAYVPFDPNSPSERLNLMLEDAQVSVLLTQEQRVNLLKSGKFPHSIVCLDSQRGRSGNGDWGAIAEQSPENPIHTVKSDNLAYVIYTSGSTGQPKGVQIEHRGLMNLVSWHQRRFQVSAGDRATQIAAPAFDACSWEILPYLAAGASIHFPDEGVRTSPEKLRDWLIAEQITLSFIPTPLAEQMLSFNWSGARLRSLLIGGDRLHHAPPASLPFEVINHYGPTENTVVTTSGVVAGEGIPSIGRAIANTQIYLLDAHLQPVPIGAKGELYIGGAGLARGYLNRPELTAACFIPHPFCSRPGSHLYKTGDMVRYRANGELDFLGRTDQQVKIRGFRIELGEVEFAIAQHPQIQAAAVVVKDLVAKELMDSDDSDDVVKLLPPSIPPCKGERLAPSLLQGEGWGGVNPTPGKRRLVAYVVGDAVETHGYTSLRHFLQTKLPEYMIPSAFVKLEALPLTPNGKVDRRTLAGLEVGIEVQPAAAPRTALESDLALLWAEVLGLKQVGIEDHFFALGGHSLLATQLTSRMRDRLQVEVPLPLLFESPTVAAIAQYIETVRWATAVRPEAENPAPGANSFREEVEF